MEIVSIIAIVAIGLFSLATILRWYVKARQPASPAGKKICLEEVEELVDIVLTTVLEILGISNPVDDLILKQAIVERLKSK